MARGAIAAGHELTARAGAAALEAGGTAVDAVVAAGAMSWAAEPALTGPCGGGFVMVRPARGRAALLDAFTAIPGRDLPPGRRLVEVEQVLVPFDQRTTQVFHVGSAACAVPGVVAGLHAAHRRYGRLPWAELVRPAAATAARGVPTNGGQKAVFDAIRAILTSTPEASAIFAPGGRYVREGDRDRAEASWRARSSCWPTTGRTCCTAASWRGRWSTTSTGTAAVSRWPTWRHTGRCGDGRCGRRTAGTS